jgi:hypothetical protein
VTEVGEEGVEGRLVDDVWGVMGSIWNPRAGVVGVECDFPPLYGIGIGAHRRSD